MLVNKNFTSTHRWKLWYTITQRVLNDLYRTRLSCGRMIRLLAHPLLCVAGELRRGGGGVRSKIIQPRESLALYKSFNMVLSDYCTSVQCIR
jgi:hypothetical protein